MKLTLSRIVHLFYYALSLFIVVAVCTIPISIGDKVIHSFAQIYLVLIYAYFFDESPPKFLRVEYLYGVATEEYNKDYLNDLLGLCQYSLSLMRKIQLHEDYAVVNQSILELTKKYVELKRLTPPKDYMERHLAILEDIQGFLEGVKEGDYYIAQGKTN